MLTIFYRLGFVSIDYSERHLDRPELHRRYFERVGDLNPENLAVYKPGQYQSTEEDFKPGFKEKRRFFLKIYVKVINV